MTKQYDETRNEAMRKTPARRRGRRLTVLVFAAMMILSALPVTAFGATQTTQDLQANVLHELNLLAGSPAGFKLHKKLNRVEAITMLIHMMGEDEAVLNGTFDHPFSDVPDWAQNYVGYAYENGLSSGVGETLFGSGRDCTQAQYLTFLLRALGYSDAAGDFTWDQPYTLAQSVGLIDSQQPLRRFSRGDMVSASYRALSAKTVKRSIVDSAEEIGIGEDSGEGVLPSEGPLSIEEKTTTVYAITIGDTLKDRLIARGVFTQQDYDDAMTVYHQGPKTIKAVYLTFDDGPSTRVTPKILDTLDANGVPATFFVLGKMVDRSPEIVRRQYQEGHKVATHGYSHDYDYLYASTSNLLSDIGKGNDAINRALGFNYNNKVFRFPGGSHKKSQTIKNAVKNAGYVYYDWNSSGEDATKASGSTAQEIVNSTIATIWGDTDNVIVLLHDTNAKGTTAEALPQIIKYFRSQGYEFRTL